ncbi:aminomethyltransferase [Mycetocola zhadangensis]|nr:aminomethyltransferase [Mycetocola zhadangensis]
MSDPVPERTSPLFAVHTELGASFTDFAGWQMPVRYTSDLAEHAAVRSAAGLFDLSHMAEILVYGADAGAFLDAALAGRLSAIDLMQAKYSLILTEDGGVLDDVVVYRIGETTYLVVANAGNRDAAFAALHDRAAEFTVTVDDQSDDYALIAVQGPNSRAILEETVGISELGSPLDELKYYRATDAFFHGVPLLIARTGYTGEDGFELYLRSDAAVLLWRAIEEAGNKHGLVPAGLASRDTLRLEAGMPLYGHELGTETFPAQAGLGRVVALSKGNDFIGRSAIEAGPPADARVLVGLTSEGKRAGRAGYAIVSGDTEVGTVSSGALSPTLQHPIMMAYVDPAVSAPGTELAVDVRGTKIPATVTTLPFYRREK